LFKFCITVINIIIFGVACFIFHPVLCFAVLMEQMAVSPKAIALANTCTADPPGLMSIHYNPAGLSKLEEGKMFEQGFTLPILMITTKFHTDPEWEGIFGQWGPQEGQEHDPVADTEDTNSSGVMYLPIYDDKVNFLLGPTAGLSTREPDSKWTFALGNYASFAAGRNFKSDSPAIYGARMLYLQHMVYASPAASYQITPKLSLGMSVGMGQTAMGAKVHMRSPNEMVALTKVLGDATKDLEIPILSELTLPPPWFGGGIGPYDQIAEFDFHARDDFSPNYNLGFLWDANEWLTCGLVYQSEIKYQLNGGYTFKYEDNWQRMVNWMGSSPLLIITSGIFQLPTSAVPYQSGNMKSDSAFPQRVQTGFKLKPTKRLSWLFDVNWVEWSVMQDNNFQFDQQIQLLKLVKMLGYTGGDNNLIVQRKLEDTISWSTGLEYQVNQKLELRCGYEWRPTSVQDNLYDLQLTFPDLHFVGLGAGIKLPHDTVADIAFGYLFNPSYKVSNNSSDNLNSTDFFKPVYNPYAGLDFEQEMNVYMISVGIRMPFHQFVEQQKHLMHKQQEAIHHLIELLKKPFSGSDSESAQ
jgi:long-subunit fatty acid transport protein